MPDPSTMSPPEVLAVECPLCSVPAGVLCVSQTDGLPSNNPHTDRVWVAFKALVAELVELRASSAGHRAEAFKWGMRIASLMPVVSTAVERAKALELPDSGHLNSDEWLTQAALVKTTEDNFNAAVQIYRSGGEK